MVAKTTHVVPKNSGGWDVKQGGADRASKHFETKREAVDWGRKLSQTRRSEFVIHRQNGTIQRKDSHGNDRFPPRG